MSKSVENIKLNLSKLSKVEPETQMNYVWLETAIRQAEVLSITLIDEIEKAISALPVQVSVEEIDYEQISDDDEMPEPQTFRSVNFEHVMLILKKIRIGKG
jgi:hypothetical protein